MSDFFIEDPNQPLKHAVEKIPNNYQKYLSDSKMRNQKLRELNEREQKKSKVGKREQGFSLYFNGANSEICTDTKMKMTSIAPRKSKTSEEYISKTEQRGKTAPNRKRWQSPTKIGFLTDRGDKMFLRPMDYYSEDFIDDERSEDLCDEEIEEEIIGEIRMDLSIDDVRALRQSLVVREQESKLDTINETSTLNLIEERILDNNEDYSETRLKQIVDRVVQLSAEQQRRLLDSLAKIEEDCEYSNNTILLSVVIESNWGHESKVGLTEIAFWTATKDTIIIRGVCVDTDISGSTKVASVIDGKRDTGKERHMWSCDFPKNGTVRLEFLVEATTFADIRFISLWNYNKSMDTLSIGVRNFSIWYGDIMLLRGIADRALGNSAFNPPTVIAIGKPKSELQLDSDLEISSDDECLMNKLRQTKNKTFQSEEDVNGRRGSARYGRRSEVDDHGEERDQLKELVEQFERETLQPQKKASLEKSWTSLSHFDMSHAGRVSLDYTNHCDPSTVCQSASEDDEFVIPELPTGRILTINIMTTWGDPHYVGLTGIEMFDASGERIRPHSIAANPADVNILPGYGDDPRVVGNLLDGVNKTRDDVHMWLAPFTAGRNHLVTIEFPSVVRLALLRIWNYNKSRIHSSRGARDVGVTLDGVMIFRGEIRRACEDGGEVILFTGDDEILDSIGLNDDEFPGLDEVDCCDGSGVNGATANTDELLASLALRPTTAKQIASINDQQTVTYRPLTGVVKNHLATTTTSGRVVRLEFAETWGDNFYIGLTGLQFLDDNGQAMTLDYGAQVTSTMKSVSGQDPRTLDKVFDEVNVTTDDGHMFLADFCEGGDHSISVSLPARSNRLGGLRVWNYNKSPEDSYRGVKVMHLWLDGRRVSPDQGYLLRRAPGHTQYDFVQQLMLGPDPGCWSSGTNVSEACDGPCGFVYQVNVFSAWRDPYYVGLNGLELYEAGGAKIEVGPHQVYAHPDSVNALTARSERTPHTMDVRTPDKLVDGHNDSYEPRHMWLAPILPGTVNKVFVVFDRPVAVAMIRLWNYGKTPVRGVRDFSVLVDDLVIFTGVLPALDAPTVARGILPHLGEDLRPPVTHWTVLLDRGNSALAIKEKDHLLVAGYQGAGYQGDQVVLTNDGPTVITKEQTVANQKFRPTTSVNRDKNQWKIDC